QAEKHPLAKRVHRHAPRIEAAKRPDNEGNAGMHRLAARGDGGIREDRVNVHDVKTAHVGPQPLAQVPGVLQGLSDVAVENIQWDVAEHRLNVSEAEDIVWTVSIGRRDLGLNTARAKGLANSSDRVARSSITAGDTRDDMEDSHSAFAQTGDEERSHSQAGCH